MSEAMGRAVQLLSMPYHRGQPRVGMGNGPATLLDDHGLVEELQRRGLAVEHEEIPDVEGEGEVTRTLELDRVLAGRVRVTIEAGRLPLVLSGNCNSCLGTVAGVGEAGLGVVWFDAHADFDTPEDNRSGFFDVLGLSLLTGTGWESLGQSISGLEFIGEPNVALVGVRDLALFQRARLEGSAVRAVHGNELRKLGLEAALVPVLDEISSRAPRAYLHVDLDSLDPSEGRANQFAAPGGLSLAELRTALDLVSERFDVRAAAVTAYDPAVDEDGRMGSTAVEVVAAVALAAVGA
jgi:arginase